MEPEPAPLEIRIETHEVAIVVVVGGQIDLYNDRLLGEAIERLYNAGHNRLVLDMSGVPFVDSAGFGLLISSQKRFRARGGQIICAQVPKNVQSVVKLSRLQDFIRIYPSRAEALAALQHLDAPEASPGASAPDDTAPGNPFG